MPARLDPVLEELIKKASKDFGIPAELLMNIIVEEKLQRYRREGDRSILERKLMELLGVGSG